MKCALTSAALLGLVTVASADPKSEAIALFDQGIKDMQAGNIDAACRELGASLDRYADSGTKGALAECLTQQHRIASAWRLWRDLADTAPSEDLRGDAKQHADALEPRLPKYLLKVDGPSPTGMSVAVGDVPVDPSLSVPLPIDPPQITITVKAPGRITWTQTLQVTEGATITIEIPRLQEAPHAEPVQVQPTQPMAPADHPEAINADPGHTRRAIGLSTAIAGIALIGIGVTYGVLASSSWDSARTMCGGQLSACPDPAYAGAQSAVDDARFDGTISTVSIAVGASALLAGAYVWWTAPDKRAGVRQKVAPMSSRDSVGLSWATQF